MSPQDTNALAPAMPDVQSSPDPREIAIDQVGIRDIRHPARVLDSGRMQNTVALCTLTVGLPHDRKGTHMSRFVQMLNEAPLEISIAGLPAWLQAMAGRLEAGNARAEFRFPYFRDKPAPVSGVTSLLDYEVTLIGELDAQGGRVRVRVVVPVTSLCPCSKEISEYGAHNQRSHITVEAEVDGEFSLDTLIATLEAQGSCELYGILKRPDEKFITERAFDNPKFVEDMIRDVAGALNTLPGLRAYRAEVENFESIHNHSAWACIERRLR
ncbi:MAG: GTP cyclohydrolase FolE2 [Halothiobacillaceae bacterium]|nr:GTP cyclohydrolase FolE2 [Halothiobacillaceae bacterium]